jgi:hypothetical protein
MLNWNLNQDDDEDTSAILGKRQKIRREIQREYNPESKRVSTEPPKIDNMFVDIHGNVNFEKLIRTARLYSWKTGRYSKTEYSDAMNFLQERGLVTIPNKPTQPVKNGGSGCSDLDRRQDDRDHLKRVSKRQRADTNRKRQQVWSGNTGFYIVLHKYNS